MREDRDELCPSLLSCPLFLPLLFSSSPSLLRTTRTARSSASSPSPAPSRPAVARASPTGCWWRHLLCCSGSRSTRASAGSCPRKTSLRLVRTFPCKKEHVRGGDAARSTPPRRMSDCHSLTLSSQPSFIAVCRLHFLGGVPCVLAGRTPRFSPSAFLTLVMVFQ